MGTKQKQTSDKSELVRRVDEFTKQATDGDLLALARDEQVDAEVRKQAAVMLGDLGRSDEAASLLLALVRDETVDVDVREAAIEALGRVGLVNESTITALVSALHDESAGMRIAAAGALAQLGQVTKAEAARLSQTMDEREVRAASAYHSGRHLVQQGRWLDGLRLLEESLAIRRQGDDLDALADVIYQIGFTHHLMGDAEQARIRYRDALRLYERTANQRGIAACKARLGHLAVQTGMLDSAVRELEQAKQIYTELGDTRRIGDTEDVLSLANRIRERQPA